MFFDDDMMQDGAMPAASDDTATEGAEETSTEETHEEAPAAEGDGSEM